MGIILFLVGELGACSTYLFIQEHTHATEGSACINTKEREGRIMKKKKGIEAERAKTLTPTLAIGVFTGEGEWNENKKK